MKRLQRPTKVYSNVRVCTGKLIRFQLSIDLNTSKFAVVSGRTELPIINKQNE